MFISLQKGVTALIIAAREGHTSIVKILVDHGAAVDIINKVYGHFVCSTCTSHYLEYGHYYCT